MAVLSIATLVLSHDEIVDESDFSSGFPQHDPAILKVVVLPVDVGFDQSTMKFGAPKISRNGAAKEK
jgi:hypothetical protein